MILYLLIKEIRLITSTDPINGMLERTVTGVLVNPDRFGQVLNNVSIILFKLRNFIGYGDLFRK
jgi:hypothetical protein